MNCIYTFYISWYKMRKPLTTHAKTIRHVQQSVPTHFTRHGPGGSLIAKRFLPCFDHTGTPATKEENSNHNMGIYYFEQLLNTEMSDNLRKCFEKVQEDINRPKAGNDYKTYIYRDLCNIRSMIALYWILEKPNIYLQVNLEKVIDQHHQHRLHDLKCTTENLDKIIDQQEEMLNNLKEHRKKTQSLVGEYRFKGNIASATKDDLPFWLSDEAYHLYEKHF